MTNTNQVQALTQAQGETGAIAEEQNQNQAVDSTSDMRAYSESVAQAADVVNNESE
jgi:hypothetical protein